MEINISLDDFFLLPHKHFSYFDGERAEYFGHTWAITINWLWFELLIIGLPNKACSGLGLLVAKILALCGVRPSR